jgi:phage tail-like protein
MDVNGLPMWLFAGAGAFGLGDRPGKASHASALEWNGEREHLTLASQQEVPKLAEDEAFARLMMSGPSPVADAADTFAWFNPSAAPPAIEASGFAPGMTAIHLGPGDKPEQPPPGLAPTDMALGDDQILYIARGGEVIFRDLRGRYPTARAAKAGFSADLLAPRPGGGAWAFDQTRNRLALVRGYPLRPFGLRDPAPDRFIPDDPNADPPRIEPFRRRSLPGGFDAVALAASSGGRLALLAWRNGQAAAIFVLEGDTFVAHLRTAGIRFPWSLAWVGEDRVAVMVSDGGAPAKQAFVYPVDLPRQSGAIPPEGRIHLLRDAWPGGFCNRLGEEPVYLTASAADAAPGSVRRLLPLSGVRYARSGGVLIGPIDSGHEGSVWHRLYLEASVPGHSSIGIDFHARDSAVEPKLPGEEGAPPWAPHLVSARQPQGDPVARAAWCPQPSELPSTPAVLACPPRPEEAGLFTVLVQHTGRKVRRVTGRYGWMYLSLHGDGRDTPELAAIRAYARRFSYRDRYLPDFYTESLTGAEAEAGGTASPADFLDRMLCLFEGSLTELEGRIAGSWMLTDPAAAPDEALPWIGNWIGIEARGAERPGLLRERLKAAPCTAQLRGTLGGLMAELELATGARCIFGGSIDGEAPPERFGSLVMARQGDLGVRSLLIGQDTAGRPAILAGGAVTRGDIVVVEGFRMRRTFATILGADLADEDDPLTLGLATSGNSFVGDTLILGEQATAELLSLFRPEIETAREDAGGVAEFFERLANRVLVLVRGIADPAEIRRLRDIVEECIPAHIEPRVIPAGTPLIVGAASLVGVDTYLTDAPETERVRLNRTIVGAGDQIRGEGWLDGRADGPMAVQPTAGASAPETVWRGAPFIISGLPSHAARGRTIDRYVWTWET